MQEDSAASAEKLVENFQDVQVYFLDQIKQRFNFLEQKRIMPFQVAFFRPRQMKFPHYESHIAARE